MERTTVMHRPGAVIQMVALFACVTRISLAMEQNAVVFKSLNLPLERSHHGNLHVKK